MSVSTHPYSAQQFCVILRFDLVKTSVIFHRTVYTGAVTCTHAQSDNYSI